MIHEELLAKIQSDYEENKHFRDEPKWKPFAALRAVVELHKPTGDGCNNADCCKHISFICQQCPTYNYPCKTIETIEKALS